MCNLWIEAVRIFTIRAQKLKMLVLFAFIYKQLKKGMMVSFTVFHMYNLDHNYNQLQSIYPPFT